MLNTNQDSKSPNNTTRNINGSNLMLGLIIFEYRKNQEEALIATVSTKCNTQKESSKFEHGSTHLTKELADMVWHAASGSATIEFGFREPGSEKERTHALRISRMKLSLGTQ